MEIPNIFQLSRLTNLLSTVDEEKSRSTNNHTCRSVNTKEKKKISQHDNLKNKGKYKKTKDEKRLMLW